MLNILNRELNVCSFLGKLFDDGRVGEYFKMKISLLFFARNLLMPHEVCEFYEQCLLTLLLPVQYSCAIYERIGVPSTKRRQKLSRGVCDN